ncbi:unnamed protein product [Linum trigynum]|uniref:Uncharacterized protein n=1 Tax=Linum trigynum TaxID=586398 RepID=A0AAV2GE44_9ROSI
MSYTFLSCAISCVSTADFSMSQIVQVVSMLEVSIQLGSISFQSKDVRGVQNSLVLLLLRTDMSSTGPSSRSSQRWR